MPEPLSRDPTAWERCPKTPHPSSERAITKVVKMQLSHAGVLKTRSTTWISERGMLFWDGDAPLSFVCVFLLPTHSLRSSHLLGDPLRRQHFRSIWCAPRQQRQGGREGEADWKEKLMEEERVEEKTSSCSFASVSLALLFSLASQSQFFTSQLWRRTQNLELWCCCWNVGWGGRLGEASCQSEDAENNKKKKLKQSCRLCDRLYSCTRVQMLGWLGPEDRPEVTFGGLLDSR